MLERTHIQRLLNGEIGLESIPSNECTEAIYLAAVEKDVKALQLVPLDKRTEAIYLAAVRQSHHLLMQVPMDQRTETLCIAAVQQNALAFLGVPRAVYSETLCLLAFQKQGHLLSYIPEEKRTELLCRTAVEQNGLALQYVPIHLRTEKLCLVAIMQNASALNFVPNDMRNETLYIAAVQRNSQMLAHIPPERCTHAIYNAAIEKDGCALRYVPIDQRTEELCLAAVREDWCALEFVPKDKCTEALCLEALQQNSRALKFIPQDKCTDAMYLAAVQDNGLMLKYVPPDKRTEDLCLMAVKSTPAAFQHVPDHMRNEAIYLVILEVNGQELQSVPYDLCSEKLCLIAVQQDGDALLHVPADKRTDAVCLAAVQQYGHAIIHIPKAMLTEKICLAAVTTTGTALQYVPQEKRDEAICLAALQQDASALAYVPEHMKDNIIQKLSMRSIIANNYLACRHFPLHPQITDEMNKYLSSIECIIVNDDLKEHELRDIQLTYAYKKTNKNKAVVSILSEDVDINLNQLLDDLKNANNSNSLDLALVGHANENSSQLGGLTFVEVSDLCANNPRIQNIHLLGCNVAKAKQPKKEKEMVEAFVAKSKLRYGMVSTLEAASENLQQQCLLFCKKNELDGVYVLNQTATGDYQLISMKYDKEQKTITEKVKTLPASRFPRGIKHILHGQKRPIPLPKQKNQLLPIRKKDHPLTMEELMAVRGLIEPAARFTKYHSKYKKDKSRYPFLAKIEADPTDLEGSLLQRLANDILQNQKITWDITIQGPTKALHVNNATKDFEITRTHLYTSDYVHSGFYTNKKNVHKKKLKEEQKKDIEQMKSAKSETGVVVGKSGARYLKVTLRKSK